jgi:hypothetical protein
MLIGIDYSINSPAVTTLGEDIKFYSFPRINSVKGPIIEALSAADVKLVEVPEEPKNSTNEKVAEFERHYFQDSITQTAVISDNLVADPGSVVAFEGFSFGSKGNRLAQISGYQYMLRWRLHSEHSMPVENLWIFSPMTVKATAGKGNFKKEQMIDAFIASEDPILQKTAFWQVMKNTPEVFQNKSGKWHKPIDDIVDSYWVLKTLEKLRTPV